MKIALSGGDSETVSFAVVRLPGETDTGIPAHIKKVRESSPKGHYLQVSISFSGKESLPDGDYALVMRRGENSNSVILTEKARLRLLLEDIWANGPEGKIVFPMGGEKARLVFRCRPWAAYDGALMRMKEFISFGPYRLRRLLRQPCRDWVVYEKFCAQAQDNGYAFFIYCMEHLPEKEKKSIYFILDR